MTASDTTHLLWTGGWDSTFRLVDLLLVKQRVVQPYYLIDHDRASFWIEMRTMHTLKNLLFRRFPECRTRLLPTVYKDIIDIKQNASITEQYQRLKASFQPWYDVGAQYEWLARFADEMGFADLELAFEANSALHTHSLADALQNSLVLESHGSDSRYRLASNPSNRDLQLFKNFRFPISAMTKADMQRVSERHGFDDLLERTWFCHSPLWGWRVPCGTCRPCRIVREEGFGRRIPLVGHIRYYLLYWTRTRAANLKKKVQQRTHWRH